jgi:hypothetical protein
MKTKNFQSYLEKRLSKQEIASIEEQVKLEIKAMQRLQDDIAKAMNNYMKKNKIGFNELVRRLDASPTHVAKIQKGKANLTLASVAHLFALLGQEPHLVFKKK